MRSDAEVIESVLCNLQTLEGRIQQLRALLRCSTLSPSEVKLLAHIDDDAQNINFVVPYLEFRTANRGDRNPCIRWDDNLATHWQNEVTPSVVRSMLETVSL